MKSKKSCDSKSKICCRSWLCRVILLTILLALVAYAAIDYLGPKEIRLKSDHAFGMSCFRARDLIVQEYDQGGNLWATRGMIIYKLEKNEEKFTRVAHVPTGFSIFWLRNFSLLRRITIRPECVEMVTTSKGDICALSAGRMWHLSSREKRFKETLRLSHYAFGDQGMRNDGIICVEDSIIHFGEYFENAEKTNVRIYTSKNSGRSWEIAYEFQPGQIRHIHAIQKDPYADKLWICTGDKDPESMVAYSQDEYKTLMPIGDSSQLWRVCQLVFTEKAVYWGTDNGSEDLSGIYRWDRETKELTKLQIINGAMFFGTRLFNGTIIMSTAPEGMRNEKDDKVRIWIVTPEDQTFSFAGGSWKIKKPAFYSKFAMLRFQRNQGSSSLAVSCLNIKEFPDAELLIFSEDTLLEKAKLNAMGK